MQPCKTAVSKTLLWGLKVMACLAAQGDKDRKGTLGNLEMLRNPLMTWVVTEVALLPKSIVLMATDIRWH